MRSLHAAGVRLLQNHSFSNSFTNIWALTRGAASDRVQRMFLGWVCFKTNVFPLVSKAFWLRLGALPATAFIACCVCFEINAFPFVLTSILALTGVLSATAFIACCWGAFASKSMLSHSFYQHFDSHWGCCLRLRSPHVAGMRLLQNQYFPIGFTIFWLSLVVLPATALIAYCWVRLLQNQFSNNFTNILALTGNAACDCVRRMLLGCVCFKINVFPLISQTF